MFKVGEIVKYAPQYCGEGEQYYIHEVKEADDGRYLISTLNTMLTLGSTQRVTEDMIQKASKYEVITWHGKYIVTDTESKKFFAGYDFMGSVEWVDNQDEAEANELEYAEQYKADLEAADEPAEPEQTKRINAGYEIIQSIKTGKNSEIVIGKATNPQRPSQYVCWDCSNGDNYNNGGYTMNYRQALAVMAERITNRYEYLPIDF